MRSRPSGPVGRPPGAPGGGGCEAAKPAPASVSAAVKSVMPTAQVFTQTRFWGGNGGNIAGRVDVLIALADAGVRPEEIDLIVVGTCTPDMPLPSTACFLQKKLGARNAFAMDLNAACSGFLYSLSVADALIRAGRGRKALVLGSEILSTVTDYTDRSTCILFGDGSGAVVLAECPEGEGILSCHLQSDGNLWELIHCPGGGTVNPLTPDLISRRMIYIRMQGNETFKHAVTKMADVAQKALAHNGYTVDDVALFIPHQANLRIVSAVGKRIGIRPDRVFVNL